MRIDMSICIGLIVLTQILQTIMLHLIDARLAKLESGPGVNRVAPDSEHQGASTTESTAARTGTEADSTNPVVRTGPGGDFVNDWPAKEQMK